MVSKADEIHRVFEFSCLLMRCGMGVKRSACLDHVGHLVVAAPRVVCCDKSKKNYLGKLQFDAAAFVCGTGLGGG